MITRLDAKRSAFLRPARSDLNFAIIRATRCIGANVSAELNVVWTRDGAAMEFGLPYDFLPDRELGRCAEPHARIGSKPLSRQHKTIVPSADQLPQSRPVIMLLVPVPSSPSSRIDHMSQIAAD